MSVAILTVQGLDKSFGTRRVLAGASFAVHERDRIGMIGANGAGKSTLLAMLVNKAMGIDNPVLEPDGPTHAGGHRSAVPPLVGCDRGWRSRHGPDGRL